MQLKETLKSLEGNYQQMDSAKIKSLVDTALGKINADMVIVNASLVNVYSGELLKGWSVAIKGDRIAYVGENTAHATGPDTRVIDATGKVLAPGFIDSHTHMLGLADISEFMKYAIKGGTTAIISETINLVVPLGHKGVLEFLRATAKQPIKIFATVAPVLSLNPASQLNVVSPEVLRRLLKHDRVVGLGETSWPLVLDDLGGISELHAETLLAGKQLEGHGAGARGNNLQAYVASGISSCHEATTAEEVLERLRLGLYVMIREGDIRRDLEAISVIKNEKIDFRRLVLCTDGIGPKYVMNRGYMETLVQKAIDLGFDPIVAIQMASLNAAEHFKLDGLIGGIAPGKFADMVILPGLKNIKADMVISNGQIIAEGGQLIVPPRKYIYSRATRRSVRLPRKMEPADFRISVPDANGPVTVRVMKLVAGPITKEKRIAMTPVDGQLRSDIEKDILKVAYIDRVNNPGKMFTGFVQGFGMKKGALASSTTMGLPGVTVVGATDEDMAGAINRLIKLQGGNVVYSEGEVLSELPLQIGGFASDLPLEMVLDKYEELRQAFAGLGTAMRDVFSMVAALSATVIPSLRICESGLMDIKTGQLVDLVV